MTHQVDDLDAATSESGSESERPDFASLRGLQVKLRIDEDQARHVQKLAAEQRTTVAATIRWLIDRGLEGEKLRSFNDVVDELDLYWARFANRFIALDLNENMVKALKERRYEEARAYAIALEKALTKEVRG